MPSTFLTRWLRPDWRDPRDWRRIWRDPSGIIWACCQQEGCPCDGTDGQALLQYLSVSFNEVTCDGNCVMAGGEIILVKDPNNCAWVQCNGSFLECPQGYDLPTGGQLSAALVMFGGVLTLFVTNSDGNSAIYQEGTDGFDCYSGGIFPLAQSDYHCVWPSFVGIFPANYSECQPAPCDICPDMPDSLTCTIVEGPDVNGDFHDFALTLAFSTPAGTYFGTLDLPPDQFGDTQVLQVSLACESYELFGFSAATFVTNGPEGFVGCVFTAIGTTLNSCVPFMATLTGFFTSGNSTSGCGLFSVFQGGNHVTITITG